MIIDNGVKLDMTQDALKMLKKLSRDANAFGGPGVNFVNIHVHHLDQLLAVVEAAQEINEEIIKWQTLCSADAKYENLVAALAALETPVKS